MLGIVSAMVRLDVVDSAQMPLPADPVEQPGAALDIFAGIGIEPSGVQPIARAKVEGFDPGQQVGAPLLAPASQIGIADAAIEGVNQVQATVAATAARKGWFHRSHIGTEYFL